ncbi:MAG: large conductance mechanosensitive channel protein MscL [Lachnospiraceae bacterium]|nr:large conductance mechanosensitive channel protein MscL [Lachnospiraceae bacterium]
MKKLMEEFKAFALKGNVMDMAVGVIIGAAFGNIITAFTENIINPLIGCIGNPEVTGFVIPLIKGQELNLGALLTAVINFLIMACAIFMMVKAVNKITSIGKKEEVVEETEKECPYCLSKIPIKAVRCPHCTSELK